MQTFKCPKFSYLPGGILGTFLLKCARSVVVLSTLPSCCNLVMIVLELVIPVS